LPERDGADQDRSLIIGKLLDQRTNGITATSRDDRKLKVSEDFSKVCVRGFDASPRREERESPSAGCFDQLPQFLERLLGRAISSGFWQM
jgi:hypothetical protein